MSCWSSSLSRIFHLSYHLSFCTQLVGMPCKFIKNHVEYQHEWIFPWPWAVRQTTSAFFLFLSTSWMIYLNFLLSLMSWKSLLRWSRSPEIEGQETSKRRKTWRKWGNERYELWHHQKRGKNREMEVIESKHPVNDFSVFNWIRIHSGVSVDGILGKRFCSRQTGNETNEERIEGWRWTEEEIELTFLPQRERNDLFILLHFISRPICLILSFSWDIDSREQRHELLLFLPVVFLFLSSLFLIPFPYLTVISV